MHKARERRGISRVNTLWNQPSTRIPNSDQTTAVNPASHVRRKEIFEAW